MHEEKTQHRLSKENCPMLVFVLGPPRYRVNSPAKGSDALLARRSMANEIGDADEAADPSGLGELEPFNSAGSGRHAAV